MNMTATTESKGWDMCEKSVGIKIIEALGLPKHIRKMEMVFEAGHPVIIKCEFAQWNINSEAESALTGLHEYELRKK